MSVTSVTVVIPTRNRCALLARSLGTAIGQVGVEDVELDVIVVDEASSDGTGQWLEGLDDPRVRAVRHERPLGVSAARNAGLAQGRGRYVAFLDDDDVWAPDKLAAQFAGLRAARSARWSCVGSVIVDEGLEPQVFMMPPPSGDVRRAVLSANRVPGGGSGVLVETALVREVGGFDAALSNLADWDLWIRLALAAPVASVHRPLVAYLRHSGGMSRGLDDIDDELRHIVTKYADVRSELGVDLAWAVWLPWIADLHLRSGRRWAAIRRYVELARRRRRVRPLLRAALMAIEPWTKEVTKSDPSTRRDDEDPEWRDDLQWLDRIRREPSGWLR